MRRAHEAAVSVATTWRLHYQLTPNDPRFLDMDELGMLEDLVCLHYRALEVEAAAAPIRAAAEDLAADPDRLRTFLDRIAGAAKARPPAASGRTEEPPRPVLAAPKPRVKP